MVVRKNDDVDMSPSLGQDLEPSDSNNSKTDKTQLESSEDISKEKISKIGVKTFKINGSFHQKQLYSAEYLVNMIEELRVVAQKSDFRFLAYLLEMAKDEALSEMDKAERR